MKRDQDDLASILKGILKPHHSLLRTELARVAELSGAVVVEQRPPLCGTLLPLFRLFHEFERELEDYLRTQEDSLFPRLLELEASLRFGSGTPEAAKAISEALRLLRYGQSLLIDALEEMRELTQGFTAPPDACRRYGELLDALASIAMRIESEVRMERSLLAPQATNLLDRARKLSVEPRGNIGSA